MPGGRVQVGKDLKNSHSLAPNLRDEGAGFFSTLFTAGSNLNTDALLEIVYLAQAIVRPIDTGKAVLQVMAGYAQKALPDEWEKYLPEDWATNKEYANAINDYYIDKYGSLEKAMDSFAEQPVSVALDAFAVKALLTTISKQAAKRATTAMTKAKTAEGTVMEGELAARAAAEAKIAQELERTVKYEGKLAWDESLGAYVPESSVVTPKVAASVEPAVANLNTEGMMRATRNQEVSPALTSSAARLSDDAMEMSVIENQIKMRLDLANAIDDAMEMQRLADEAAAAGRADYSKASIADDADLPFAPLSVSNSVNRATDADGVALNILRSELEFAKQKVNNPVTLDLGGKVTPAATVHDLNIVNNHPAKIAALESQIAAKADEAKLVRDNKRMLDDAAMASATQGELFANVNAAAYETYQASRLLDEVKSSGKVDVNVPATRGMLATSPETRLAQLSRTKNIDIPVVPRTLTDKPAGPISRTKDIDLPPARTTTTLTNKLRGPISRTRDIDLPPPRMIPKPESASRGFKPLEINAYRVLPAIQRIAAAANQNQLTGDRDIDGSLIPMAPDRGIDLIPDSGLISDKKDEGETRPGWMQGNTHEPDDGNWWSADFEDEHWNTPAGVNEAISIWGRPMGSRHSWETPAAIKSQYTNRQPADWSWMNQYD